MTELAASPGQKNKAETINGVLVDSHLAHWELILKQWCKYVDQWCETAAPDRPWFYEEMPNEGILSAAAMACGHPSLVESGVRKRTLQGGSYDGRSDLWVRFVSSSSENVNTEEFLELKKDPVYHDRINTNQFNKVVIEAESIDHPCRAKIAACMFTVGFDIQGKEIEIPTLVDEIRRKTGADAIAWVFPRSIRMKFEERNVYAPGAILALKLVGQQSTDDYSSHRTAGVSEV